MSFEKMNGLEVNRLKLVKQIIFLFVGIITIVSAPIVYWKLDNDILSAPFLTEHERMQAIERVRVNQTGIGCNAIFKWDHVFETLLEPKTYLLISMSLLLNVGDSVVNVFGPIILNSFGFTEYRTSLLNIPFVVLPVIAGLEEEEVLNGAALLAAYYLLAFLFGGNPLIVAWIVGNTAGMTGNIGRLALFGVFIVLAAVVILQVMNLRVLNKLHQRSRVAAGKQAVIKDYSMDRN
ncbi:hypothetical protein CPC735_059920 [Coccidioides posadasii C735 delta SOWgp]|uniref:Uncharacterized protein n=1 Tax=Coccidioides posadasii (strain C735) TaxID=222929 RepID=C5PF42_COCP7|nr:hypothetical protein CPC735_059920 [Coccidioides posadasii C735 delta SOWgp]EER24622.1 hypothetical protein CPC735_059920 [Coccidioides posadasii C735 delta SOWgp]|eukprot:XP_003066767.1 hypothetical protein CPC735_059920 [Coccidioides posadasii C735 delta SOWgp]